MASGPSGARDEAPAPLGRDGGGTSRSRLCCSIGDARGTHVRKGSFQPKQHLEHLVEKLKLLGLDGGREKEQLCSWRRIPWDAEAPGSGRDGPRACGGPSTEEPTQDEGSSVSQEQTRKDLETLRSHREALWERKAHGERRCQDYLARTELQRQAVVLEFRRLRRFLRDQELLLLLQLGELDTEAMGRQEQEDTKIQGEISLLDVLICAMEKQLQGPGSTFLQDARSAVDRLEMGSSRRITETFQDLEQKLQVISRQNCVLRDVLGTFQDTLLSELEKEQGPSPGGDGRAPFVTLDPSTASPRLEVSRDRRGAQRSRTARAVPGSPLRFNGSCCVLGSAGFAAGAHHWAVGVAGAGAWALGVARGSVSRRGWIPFRPDQGVWAVGRCGSRFCAFTEPVTPLPSAGWAGRVRVALDYEGGKVRFYLAEGDPPVFTFPTASFGGESVFPFFWLGKGSSFRLCP
ncbi:E3 ubiquitin-protein ligase TRIM15-like [Lathamus discolor]|uniref:E3 ubiquitin-protein ligase TRIM15-like n=1 Tax=Lathamus discolor TaxID=678569 RepID=UPI0032B80A68